ELAQAEGMPPYVIFHDRTLQAMVKLQPDRLEDLLQLPGVGQAKLGRYGRAFFEVIERHQLDGVEEQGGQGPALRLAAASPTTPDAVSTRPGGCKGRGSATPR